MDADQAFDTLLSELVAATRDAQQQHQVAEERNDLTLMVEQHERVMSVLAAREGLERLRDSWAHLVGEGEPRERVGPTYGGARAPRGAKTPGETFWVPILQVLEEAGGLAAVSAVEDGVGELMAMQLNEVDRARVRSGAVRWRVTVRFALHDMLQEGLLVDTSPRGVWEISQDGRAYLRRYRGENEAH